MDQNKIKEETLKYVKTAVAAIEEKKGEDVKKAKRRYYFHRFFPEDAYYKKRYPFFYRHRMLRPFLTVYRCIKGILFHRKHLRDEMKNVIDTK